MIRTQPFGRTGHDSTALIFGAFAIGACDQNKANLVFEKLLEHGVNHIDTAHSYGDSELRIGPWMNTHRDSFFLATKTGERGYGGAMRELEKSLKRLRTDSVDLIQMHNLVDREAWNTAMGPGGALDALVKAQEQGKVRYIGVTGHGLDVARMHLRSLHEYSFDSVLLPWNFVLAQNETYRTDFQRLVSYCERRGIAVQTIKGLSRRPWGKQDPNRLTWYQPLERQSDIDAAVGWILDQPGLFLNSAGDPDLLLSVLDAADRFSAGPSAEVIAHVMAEREMAGIF